FDWQTNALEVRVEPGEVVRAALSVTPRQRGRAVVPAAQIDARFPAGFARRRWDLPADTAVSVYPDLSGLNRYDALRRGHALSQVGIHTLRMTGSGREFDQFRDYQPDDDYSAIDWKATAHHRKPITTLYRAERSRD